MLDSSLGSAGVVSFTTFTTPPPFQHFSMNIETDANGIGWAGLLVSFRLMGEPLILYAYGE
jgi:hypothetical protein